MNPTDRLRRDGLLPLWDFLKWHQGLPAHLDPEPETTYTSDFGDHAAISAQRQTRLQRLREAKASASLPEAAFYRSIYKCDFTEPARRGPRLPRRRSNHEVLTRMPGPTPDSVYCADFGQGKARQPLERHVRFLPPIKG